MGGTLGSPVSGSALAPILEEGYQFRFPGDGAFPIPESS